MTYLNKIGRRYYFRVRIPEDVKKYFPVSVIKKSLKTTDLRYAKVLLKMLSYETERVFTLLRSNSMLNDKEIHGLVQRYLHDVLRRDEDFRTSENFEDFSHLEKIQKAYAWVIEDLEKDIALNNLQSVSETVDSLLQGNGLLLDKDSKEYKKLCREVLKANAEYFKVGLERYKGNYDNPYDRSSSLSPVRNDNGKLLSEVIDEYCKDKELTSSWTERTKDENKRMYKLFLDIVSIILKRKNVEIKDVSRSTIQKYGEMLSKIPSNMNKRPEYKNKSLNEVVEIAAKNGEKLLLSDRTRSKHMEEISSVFKWAVRHEYLNRNVAEGLSIKIEEREDEQRNAYSREDLTRLLQSPFFTTKIPVDSPERFFVPLIGLFTGLRIDEICQLYVEDVKKIDGVWCFDINKKDDKKLKTRSSQRIVPIHPSLQQIGILDYIAKLKREGRTRLWENLEKKRNGYAHDFGKWFGRYNRKYITKDTKKTFHSFRHTFTNNLKQKGVQEAIISELAGHKQYSMTMGRYGKRYAPQLLLEAVMQLDFGICIEHLRFPPSEE